MPDSPVDSTLPTPVSDAAGDDLPHRRPIWELLALAGPTIAQMASYTLMQFIDTWILTRLGVTAPTAAANAGMISFSAISLGMGIMFVVNTLVSQSFGRRDLAGCGRYLWQGIWVSVGFTLLLLPLLPVLPRVFQMLGHEAELVRLETLYLQIVLPAAGLKLVATALGEFMLGIDRPMAVSVASATGVAVNACVAWGLVLGKWGLPRLEVAGAGWAQNAGVFVEMLVLAVFATRPYVRNTFGVLTEWRFRPAQALTLLKVGIPSGVQIVADVLAWSAFQMWVMSGFRTEAMAANIFVFRYMSVSFMPAFGLSIAVTALVGRYIGRGRPDIAAQRANLGFAVTAVYMVACGLLFFFGRSRLMGLFTKDPEVLRIGQVLLVVAAIYQLFDAMYIIYNGALRGAGDTLVPAIMTATMCWAITVFGGYFVARTWPRIGPVGPWVAAALYGVILGVFLLVRFRRGGWRSIRLEKDTGVADAPGYGAPLSVLVPSPGTPGEG